MTEGPFLMFLFHERMKDASMNAKDNDWNENNVQNNGKMTCLVYL